MKIIFVTPSLRRTGSSVVLYNLLSSIRGNIISPIAIVGKDDGELFDTINRKIKVFKFNSLNLLFLCLIHFPVLVKCSKKYSRFGFNKKFLFYVYLNIIFKKYKPDIYYINTITLPEAVEVAADLKIPCIVHSHELEQMLAGLDKTDIQQLIQYPKLIIACSDAAANVIRILGRQNNIVTSLPGIDFNNISYDHHAILCIKEEKKIHNDSFIWIASGTIDVNKNPIRFVLIAYELIIKRGYNAHFIWIGANKKNGLYIYAKNFANNLRLTDSISWIEPLKGEEYYNHLALADAFIVTSDRESLSLVALESLYLNKPIVSFNCGGINEVIQHNYGTIVDSWNINDFVDEMISVMNSKHPSIKVPSSYYSEFSIEQQVIRWENIINSYIKI